ncbi:hypothetical protein [Flavobacterium sp. UBA7680]|uniref:hypothetical protein n=1 Tax=Flavobacterium sp. UBA7680 TaxID=1946559 RepID=UPI0025B9EEC2|nr:hypothetical protein [Flavobacterium sp. UBA7680]
MKKALIILTISLVSIYFYKYFITEDMIAGTYVNRNYENDFIGENPHVADTLIILKKNNFVSSYFGNGTYELNHTIFSTNISLNYDNGHEQGSLETSIERIFFGNLKINLNQDLDQYYEKIK